MTNVVVIQTDDQGRWAVPWRMPELVMPNLASLAEDGLELDQLYCASPVCSPSRASVLTGRLPSAHGVHDWLVGERSPEVWPDDYLAGQPTTPEVLARAGYQCAMVGKWHLGDARCPAPGFEYWYAHRYGGGDYVGAPIWDEGEAAREPRYFTTAVTEQALDFLATRDRTMPFYLQVNYTAPHTPWIDSHLPEYLALYDGCDFESVPREQPHPWVEPRGAEFAAAFAEPEPHLAGYCASLTAVDHGLGAIMQALDDQGVRDDTLVVFFSDNGFSCGQHGVWGKGNGTYPLNFWDNSVRVPCVVRLPGGARGVSDELLSAASWHATICEVAGVTPPDDSWRLARSFADVLRGERGLRNEVVVVVSEYGGGRMITDGAWVYVARHDGPDELYDMRNDPGQRVNLADDPACAEMKDDLGLRLQEWFAAAERPGYSAYDRRVTGYGQLQPLSRGLPDDRTYVQFGAGTMDGGDPSRLPA